MLVILPLFICIGFIIGYSGRRLYPNAKYIIEDATSVLLFTLASIAVIGVFFSFVPTGVEDVRPRGWFLLCGGIGMGFAAGLWFSESKDERDRLIFISAAALLLVLSALEYDLKIFGHITKFGVATVNLELAGSRSSFDNTPTNQQALASNEGGPFLGANRVDTALNLMSSLGEYALRDEQYAQIFSGAEPAVSNSKSDFAIDDATRRFVTLACNKISDLADDFRYVQWIFRADSPASAMRIREQDSDKTGTKATGEVLGIGEAVARLSYTIFDNHDDMETNFKNLEIAIEGLADIAKTLRNKSENILADQKSYDPRKGKDKKDPKKLCYPFIEEKPMPILVPNQASKEIKVLDNPPDFAYSAYHAILISLAQFAVGNREGAVQLLDLIVSRQKAQLDERHSHLSLTVENCSSRQDDCKQRQANRLEAYRRLITIARLENMEESLLEAFGDTRIDAVRVRTLQDLTDDYSLAFTNILKQDSMAPHVFGDNNRSPAADACGIAYPGTQVSRKMLARWSIVRAYQVYSMLDIMGRDPNLLRIQLNSADKFDRYAAYIENFNFGCIKANDVTDVEDQVPAQFIRGVGDYWSARAAIYAENEESEAGHAVAALCRAKADYKRAETLLVSSKNDERPLTRPDRYLLDYKNKVQPFLIHAALRRVKESLNRYPAGLIDKHCTQ